MKEDSTYPERFRQAMQQGVRTLEDHCVKLAFEGVKRMVTYKGKPVIYNGQIVYETEFDSQLIIFLLKAYDRKRFGDKIDTTFGPNWNGNLEVVVLGSIHGNVEATDKIDIRKQASITGDIIAARIEAEDGAYLKGSVDTRR